MHITLGRRENSTSGLLCLSFTVLQHLLNSIGWLNFDSPTEAKAAIRDWVSPNLPVVIRGGASHFPALSSWTPQLLRPRIGRAKVTVAVTPDGLADAPKVEGFMIIHLGKGSISNGEFLVRLPECA